MGFLDKAKQAANEMAAKADQAMANAGISGPAGAPGGMGANRAADAALRDFGLITWREAHGHPVDASEKERVLHTLQGLEAGGQLAPLRCTSPQGAGGLYGSPPPGAPPPPPGYAAQQAAASTALPSSTKLPDTSLACSVAAHPSHAAVSTQVVRAAFMAVSSPLGGDIVPPIDRRRESPS